ncbi:hypothetical protein BSR28_06095 [Boudabousia liubingyangii]|uniref:hypothetical protein n=1 Tax=Boudabousia liubingyangii TaxID=1921764 RepID=UPI00093EF4F4|nr:hypothetical protein [Boudabousia liubingyangii]OKL46988.1 hypothetical protein BSR28_06095 [Boudabousia liubingyangii]
MNFYDWMIQTHRDGTGPASHLAADMEADFYAGPYTHKAILAHLHACGAIDACIETFEECWREYLTSPTRKRRSKRRPLKAPRPLIGRWEDSNQGTFLTLDKERQQALMEWIRTDLTHGRDWCSKTSYGLKHLFERDTGHYVTNAQFKDAMIIAGYQPKNIKALNHCYRLHPLSPAFNPEGH